LFLQQEQLEPPPVRQVPLLLLVPLQGLLLALLLAPRSCYQRSYMRSSQAA
jgi:hypothetical protein